MEKLGEENGAPSERVSPHTTLSISGPNILVYVTGHQCGQHAQLVCLSALSMTVWQLCSFER